MKTIFLVLGIIFQFYGTTHSLIIPDELPSLLSVIYSNIPTIKKGTDSRVGWGFRFGNRADFQVLVELGPQTNTQPLANQDGTSNNKRQVSNNLGDTLYAQQQSGKEQISNTDGGKWLSQWRQSMRNAQYQAQAPTMLLKAPIDMVPDLGIGEVDAKLVIPDDSALALEELYKKREKHQQKNVTTNKGEAVENSNLKQKIKEIKNTTLKPKTTTSAKDALDNVDLDEDS